MAQLTLVRVSNSTINGPHLFPFLSIDDYTLESGKDVVLVVDGRDVSGNQDLQNSFYHDGVNPGAHIVLNNAFIDGLVCEKGKSLNGKCVTDLARDCERNIVKAANKLGRVFLGS